LGVESLIQTERTGSNVAIDPVLGSSKAASAAMKSTRTIEWQGSVRFVLWRLTIGDPNEVFNSTTELLCPSLMKCMSLPSYDNKTDGMPVASQMDLLHEIASSLVFRTRSCILANFLPLLNVPVRAKSKNRILCQ
jgi:hypothetical protein